MRIDPRSRHVETILGAAPRARDSLGVGSLAVGDGSLWTVRDDVLTRWSPVTTGVIATISIPRAALVARSGAP